MTSMSKRSQRLAAQISEKPIVTIAPPQNAPKITVRIGKMVLPGELSSMENVPHDILDNNPIGGTTGFTIPSDFAENPEYKETTYTRREQEDIMAEINAKEAQLPEVSIDGYLFQQLNDRILESVSVCEVNNKNPSGPMSLFDTFMGTVEQGQICRTCSKSEMFCNGHIGRMKLVIPIIWPSYYDQLVHVMSSICFYCGSMLLSKFDIDNLGFSGLAGEIRLKSISEHSKGVPCNISGCKKNPIFNAKRTKINGLLTYSLDLPKEKGVPKTQEWHVLAMEELVKKLNAISDEDAILMGFRLNNHPKDFVRRYVPITPPNTRPPLYENGQPKQNSITLAYMRIIGFNNEINSLPLSNKDGRRKAYQNLIFAISHLLNNSDQKFKWNGQALKSFTELFGTKEGYMRHLVLGKAVNFSARTVGGPSAGTTFGYLGIPREFQRELTKDIRAQSYNIERLTKMLREGKINYIKPATNPGQIIKVREKIRDGWKLRIGDIVQRHLMEGDWIINNRQPSIARNCMSGYRIYFHDGRTIRLHMFNTTQHNADFDGDELNLHVPQDEMATAETMILLNTRKCMMSEGQNRPIGGVVYDAVTACYLATRTIDTIVNVTGPKGEIIETTISSDIMIPHERFLNYSLFISNPDYSHDDLLVRGYEAGLSFEFGYQNVVQDNDKLKILGVNSELVESDEKHKLINKLFERLRNNDKEITLGLRAFVKTFSGKLMFSALLPKTFTLINKDITIENGILKIGTITKSQVGPSQNAIHQYLQLYYSSETAANFINDVYLVMDQWLADFGHSVSISDCVPDNPKYKNIIKEEIEKARLTVIAMQAGQGEKKEEVQDEALDLRKEQNIILAVDVSKNVATKAMKEATGPQNRIKIMVESGAKGNISQASQLGFGILGQQFKKEWRMPLTISGGTRFLPTSVPFDPDPAARGFVDRSFYQGLTPTQFFAHNLAARGGLVATSVLTALTGTMQRRMIKFLEDLKVEYDGTVRNQGGMVFEWVAGYDGYDPRETHFVKTKKRGEILAFADVGFMMNKIRAQIKLQNE